METYIIKIYEQSLCFFPYEDGGITRFRKILSFAEVIKDITDNGLCIHGFTWSQYEGCYEIKVSGEYVGNIKIYREG
jgi:hypothetical protein